MQGEVLTGPRTSPTLERRGESAHSRRNRGELQVKLEQTAGRSLPAHLHPILAEVYRRKMAELQKALDDPGRDEAMELIDRVELKPRADRVTDVVADARRQLCCRAV